MHHEIWLPVGSQRSQVARSGDTGTAEEPHARLDHLPKLIHRLIIIGRRRLRSHLLRRRPYRPNRESVTLHLWGKVGAGGDDDLMIGSARRIHQRQHRIEVTVQRVGGEQDPHIGQSISGYN